MDAVEMEFEKDGFLDEMAAAVFGAGGDDTADGIPAQTHVVKFDAGDFE